MSTAELTHAAASASAHQNFKLDDVGTPKLSPDAAKGVVAKAGVLAVVGLAASAGAFAVDRHHAAMSWLVGFAFVTTLCLGALFFVVIQHLTRAAWSVAARRQAEWIASALPACAALFLPVLAFSKDIYVWLGPEAAHDENLHKKAAWLNPGFWTGRAVFYFVLWSAIALFFARHSQQQDADGKDEHTHKMQALSAPATLLFALSASFASFDWLMSLQPHWYSTIFGVYIFSGAMVATFATLALLTIRLQVTGYFKKVSTVEHRHDIGKLLFGFTVFWAYIAFSQFFLIWYANLPEEIVFFHQRLEGGWHGLSVFLPVGHFVVPFALLLSRHVKRSIPGLTIGAILLLVMHYLDLYWIVMPTFEKHGPDLAKAWIDVAALLGPIGVIALVVARKAATTSLFPVKDPRLAETLHLENL